ncbi:MAG: hypothetical protein ACI88G_002419 [Woeseiaceae bacterium]|jgi:hypothetical protein
MRHLFLAGILSVCCGCAANVQWAVSGGDKDEGTVVLSYMVVRVHQGAEGEGIDIYNPMGPLDEADGQPIADAACMDMGYSHAQAFLEGAIEECTRDDLYGACNRWMVTMEYQCRN